LEQPVTGVTSFARATLIPLLGGHRVRIGRVSFRRYVRTEALCIESGGMNAADLEESKTDP